MQAIEFHFDVITRLRLSNTPPNKKSQHVRTDIRLEFSRNLDKSQYLLPGMKDLPNKEGSSIITDVLVSGLIGNIHMAHQKGWRDSAEHLRHIIKQLEDQFILQANIGEGRM